MSLNTAGDKAVGFALQRPMHMLSVFSREGFPSICTSNFEIQGEMDSWFQ